MTIPMTCGIPDLALREIARQAIVHANDPYAYYQEEIPALRNFKDAVTPYVLLDLLDKKTVLAAEVKRLNDRLNDLKRMGSKGLSWEDFEDDKESG